jgi:hypothetical protein
VTLRECSNILLVPLLDVIYAIGRLDGFVGPHDGVAIITTSVYYLHASVPC